MGGRALDRCNPELPIIRPVSALLLMHTRALIVTQYLFTQCTHIRTKTPTPHGRLIGPSLFGREFPLYRDPAHYYVKSEDKVDVAKRYGVSPRWIVHLVARMGFLLTLVTGYHFSAISRRRFRSFQTSWHPPNLASSPAQIRWGSWISTSVSFLDRSQDDVVYKNKYRHELPSSLKTSRRWYSDKVNSWVCTDMGERNPHNHPYSNPVKWTLV